MSFLSGCSFRKVYFPSDSNMLEQWKREKSAFLSLANECRTTKNTYSSLSLYSRDIPTNAIDMFQGCKFRKTSLSKKNTYQFIYAARDTKQNQVLFVTSQHITQEGWWIWKEPILEEKGFIYVSQDKQLPINSEYQPIDKLDSIKTGLDQFVGDYKLTKEPGKIDTCEIWMFRPITPKWYLFYRQNRGCQFRGL